MIIRMPHIRASKMCSSGAREFFKQNNLDWQDFLKNGIESEILMKTNDFMALQVINMAMILAKVESDEVEPDTQPVVTESVEVASDGR